MVWENNVIYLSYSVEQAGKPGSPFRCVDNEIYLYRNIECVEKEKFRQLQQDLKVFQKSTVASRARERKTFKKLEQVIDRESEDDIEEKSSDVSWALAFAKSCQSDTQSITEYISEQKELFLLEYAVKTKQRAISKMEEKAAMEERKAKNAETKLEDDSLAFEEFLKENDKSSVDALKMASQEAKAKNEVMAEVRSAMNEVFSLKSEITNAEDLLRLYLSYEAFLLSISPKEWQDQQIARKKKKRDRKSILSKSFISVPSRDKTRLASTSFLLHHKIHKWAHAKGSLLPKGPPPGRKLTTARSASLLVPREEEKKSTQRTGGDYRFFRRTSRSMSLRTSLGDKKYMLASERSVSLSSEEEFSLDEIPSDEEPEIYFKDPDELLQLFRHLEEQNLSLFQNIQEISGTLEDRQLNGQAFQERMEERIKSLIDGKEALKAACAKEEAKSAQLALKIQLFSATENNSASMVSYTILIVFYHNDITCMGMKQRHKDSQVQSMNIITAFSFFHILAVFKNRFSIYIWKMITFVSLVYLTFHCKLLCMFLTIMYYRCYINVMYFLMSFTKDKLLNSLTKKVAEVYKVCSGGNEVSSLNPFQMLKAIEIRVSELCEMFETLPKEYLEIVEANEKLRAKERRQRIREDKLKELRRIQEERLKHALERAIAAPKKRVSNGFLVFCFKCLETQQTYFYVQYRRIQVQTSDSQMIQLRTEVRQPQVKEIYPSEGKFPLKELSWGKSVFTEALSPILGFHN
nr:PREDICTED: LOW QUALITY PROTEIN: coiled-coil domain-containing protein 38 [Anolis carolinensis]|eukprot:XP_016849654.1 PREDICTED: LOW QUALITY PROTEIN: coiled-coil domain-containing protein 38 [Anolis carolinensis]